MTDNTTQDLPDEVWRTYFTIRTIGLVVLAGAALSPLVSVDPAVAAFALLVGVPVSLILRAAVDFVVPRSWIVVVIDTFLISATIAIDPIVAPAGGVLLLASSSITAASSWRSTVVAAVASAPVIVVVLLRQAPDATVPITLTYLVCSVGVASFVAGIARSERDSRLERERLIDGLDAIVWEGHPYPFVEAWFSGGTADLVGLDATALAEPGAWLARLPPLDRARIAARSQRLIDAGEDHELTYRVLDAAGEVRHVRDRVRVEVDETGRPVAARGVVVDITEQVKVRETNRNLAELVERVKVGLLVLRWHDLGATRTFTTLSVNPAYEQLAGQSATALTNTDTFEPITGPGRKALEQVVCRTAETGRPQRIAEAEALRPGMRTIVELEAFPISESLIGVNVSDITGRVTAAEALRHQALHDPLTGLANRSLLENRLRHAISAAERNDTTVGLLLLDLDGFKEVNDTLGHDQGDRVLRLIANRLGDAMRSSDTVARLGGDEFAVLLADDPSPRRTRKVADRVMQCFDEAFEVDGMSLQCGGSLGVAIHPEHGSTSAELRKHADIAMYVAKRRGGGVEVYDPIRDQPDTARLALVHELRGAIEEDKLAVHYQPIIDLDTGSIERVEAFLRWTHPDLGAIPPIDFIDLAEVSGLIRPLTGWVLDQALNDLRRFRDIDTNIGVAINISARNLYEPHFVDDLAGRLAEHAVAGRHVTLELTETQVMDDPILASDVLGRLGTLGVRSSVDDFGTGHSSLANLQSLPVSEVKIDKSFVHGMADGEHAANAIVRSIVGLGHNLGMTVVAEGVEDAETLETLTLLGCDRAQGYQIDRPMPAHELERRLSTARHGSPA